MSIAFSQPSYGETIKTFESLSEKQIDEKLQLAASTFRSYRHTPLAERESMLLRAAEILETEKDDFARLMTTEMGKPIKGAVGEAEKCALVCRYYAENAKHHLADQARRNKCKQELRLLPASRPSVGGHALEFSVLASLSFRSARADGW